MKKILFTAALLGAVLAGKAQFAYNYLKAADYYFRNADYNSAAQYYEKYLAGNRSIVSNAVYKPYNTQQVASKKQLPVSSEHQAIYKLAESYRLLHDYSKAVPWYAEAMEFDKSEYPLAPYYYAVSLRALSRYDLAEKAFAYFLDTYQTADKFRDDAKREQENLHFIVVQLARPDLSLYTIEKGNTNLNPEGANYAPAWLGDTLLLFTSTRPDNGAAKNHVFTNRVYGVKFNGAVPDSISRFALPQPKNEEQGVISISPDGNTLFLTRWIKNKKAAIYSSHKNGDNWTEPVLLDSIVNAAGYSAQQPFVTADGKRLLYASDRPGGEGGLDIWEAQLNGDGTPFFTKNLGPVVNTASNEQAPYYHAASGLLVFSTDGRVGMGGYDFFYTKDSAGNYTTPVNFGYPVNSVKDDIYFSSKGSKDNILEGVWLSSDRSASCCLELFTLNKRVPPPPPPPPPVPETPVAVAPPPAEVPVVLDNVYYDFSQSYLQPASYPALDKLVAMLQAHPEVKIELSAHTDSKGSDALNQKLSDARAKSCVDYLVSKGVAAERLTWKGYAATMPLAPNTNADGSDNPEGRARNRRTEFKVIK
ncbi:OmpA family protein [Chitinophaga sancti]|uniref:OmpA family protein n=1 Tax=Chitinophaga sancti TaxID=1004 RepID=A0A1K1SHZ5_9BACT|nr:OmpA family protein [Chitinophaga sancti]WQD61839.1 OmpA family protein [Chitinophaga sancti]WQG92592.1 OmpA family protein [Chitinophaga sancti]SFW83764.1 Outer membrane protein OmpA [Chitinophaga sancti]